MLVKMPYRITPLVKDNFYHVFNRGVEKRITFTEERDFKRFLQVLYYYQFSGPKPPFSDHKRFKIKDFSHNPKIMDIICYCLMPNHFHLLLKQATENGISEFIAKVINSYTKYFNTRYKRVGPLFQGTFKAVLVEDDSQLIHLSRYIHLNPYTSGLVQNLQQYNNSSYSHFIGLSSNSLCVDEPVLCHFKNRDDYKKFVEGHEDYARELEIIKHLLLEDE